MSNEFKLERMQHERTEAKTFGFGSHIFKAGDGLMKDAVVTLSPDGKLHFRTLVKTEFTHSRDIWHVFFILKDGVCNPLANVPPLVSLPAPFPVMPPQTFQTWFDGPGMLQGQDYQVWDFTYHYPLELYAKLEHVVIYGEC